MVRYVANRVSFISAKFGEIICNFRPLFVDETKFGYMAFLEVLFKKKNLEGKIWYEFLFNFRLFIIARE